MIHFFLIFREKKQKKKTININIKISKLLVRIDADGKLITGQGSLPTTKGPDLIIGYSGIHPRKRENTTQGLLFRADSDFSSQMRPG
jgi:hypothetical protein